jgi:hypothetical protein
MPHTFCLLQNQLTRFPCFFFFFFFCRPLHTAVPSFPSFFLSQNLLHTASMIPSFLFFFHRQPRRFLLFLVFSFPATHSQQVWSLPFFFFFFSFHRQPRRFLLFLFSKHCSIFFFLFFFSSPASSDHLCLSFISYFSFLHKSTQLLAFVLRWC